MSERRPFYEAKKEGYEEWHSVVAAPIQRHLMINVAKRGQGLLTGEATDGLRCEDRRFPFLDNGQARMGNCVVKNIGGVVGIYRQLGPHASLV